jgi:hypothetical protein
VNARELIRAELARSREPDPHKITRKLVMRLNDADRLSLVTAGMTALVMEEIHFSRMEAAEAAEAPAPGPSRRSVVRQRVCAAGDWKMLDDCNVADLEAIALDYRSRETQMATKAVEYEAMAERLRRSGCATVGEMLARTKVAA